MKTSVVVADGSFDTTCAPLLGSYEFVAGTAAEIGFDAIQLTVNRPKEVDCAEVLAATQKYGLAVSSIATGLGNTVDGLSLGSADESNRKAAVARMKEHVDLAARLGGAKVIIGIIRGWIRDGGDYAGYMQQMEASSMELAAYAEKNAVDIILESNDHFETDSFLTIRETADFIRHIGSPRFRLQIDTMHILYENDDFYSGILRNADMLAQVDISGPNRSHPGEGFDYPLLMKALKQIDYKNYLVFEHRALTPMTAAKTGLDFIRSLM